MSALKSAPEGLPETLAPLHQLSPPARSRLLEAAEYVHVERGSFVFREGDTDDRTLYLLEGQLELLSGDQVLRRIAGGTAEADSPLAQLQPRQLSARALSEVALLCLPRALFNELVRDDLGDTDAASVTVEVDEIESTEQDDWMTRMLRSKLFAQLPASNIHRIFSLLETIEVPAGEQVVTQGEPGDYYFILINGRAEVTRAASPGAPSYRLALIGAGDAFGEEALVGDGTRNASVRMLTPGELARLAKRDFIDLIREPLLSAVNLQQGLDLVATRGALWLDVRFPEEHARRAIAASVNHPLSTLRMHSGRLNADKVYLVYCDDGSRSAVAAFLLAERGFDVHYLAGGLDAYAEGDAEQLDLTLHDDDSLPPVTRGAVPIPSSHRSAGDEDVEPAVKAAALQVESVVAELSLDDAATAAPRATPVQASSSPALAEPQSTGASVAPASQAGGTAVRQHHAAAVREAAARARAEVQRAAAKRIAAERERARQAVEVARAKAEEEARERLENERRRAQAEAESRVEEARARARAEAEARVESERARAAQAARDELESERQRLAAETEKARAELAEAQRLQAAAQAAQQAHARAAAAAESERQREAEEQLRAERERLEAEAAKARAELAEAQRMKSEIEQARLAAEAEVERERAAQARRVEQVRAEMQRRLEEEERRIRESYAWQAEELERLQAQKQAAEARLHEEQERVRRQSEEASARLAEARDYQQRLEEVKKASAAEAAMRERQQLELERRLREELKDKVQSERRQLEEELARNATELARARHELVAAEAARKAAAEEAQQIVADVKAAHARRRMQEESEMQLERARLETEARRLRLALELAEREKAAAVAEQQRIGAEIATLRREGPDRGHDHDVDLRALEEQADEVARHLADTERARADAQAAAIASEGDLAAHRVHEEQVRGSLKDELDEWLREQSALEESDVQQSILANQKAHLERIRKRAAAAREAAKAHDQALIDELANRLRNPIEDD
ncbi:MAG: cyclic nucleotide-binding domain-containing protein [Gammaproteobacteria bacterium]